MSIVRILVPALLLGLAGAGSSYAQTVTIVSGQGQVTCLGFCINSKLQFDPLVVKVTDAAGRPVPNATVTWTVINGQYSTVSANQTLTDATGQTSVTYSSTFFQGVSGYFFSFLQGQVTATAGVNTVTFTETQGITNPQSPSTAPITIGVPVGVLYQGSAGQPSATPLSVTVTSTLGNPIAGVAVQLGTDDQPGGPTVACQNTPDNPPGVVLTDASGTANCTMVFGPIVGQTATFKVLVGAGGPPATTTAYFVSAPLNFTVSVGPPGQILITRGNNQQATLPGTNLPAPLVGTVADLGGNPVGGANVVWSVIPPTAATLFNQRTTSAVDGLVSTNVTIGSPTGPFQVRVALASNQNIGATFTVQAAAVTISSLTKVSGDGQDAGQNSPFPAPLVVQAATNGAATANVPVSFTVTSGSATLSANSALTNSSGQAQVTVTAGPTIGPVVVTASAGTLSQTFNLTVRAPGPSFSSNSFVNAYSRQAGISPCSLATINAASIAPGASGLVTAPFFGPLPKQVNRTVVAFGSVVAPIVNANGTDSITVQVPCEVQPGTVPVTISVLGTPKSANVDIVTAKPGILETTLPDGTTRAVLVRQDGSFVDPVSNPARKGDIIRMYVTGLGATAPSPSTGGVPVPDVDANVTANLVIGVNNAGVRMVSAKAAQNMIGTAVVAFEVPSDAPTGDLVLSIGVVLPDGSVAYSQGSKISVQ